MINTKFFEKHDTISLFHNGQELTPQKEKTIDSFQREFVKLIKIMKSEKKKVHLIFDLDGVLVPAGIETPAFDKALEEHFIENEKISAEFTTLLRKLRNKGYRIGINTGRGVVFARRIVRNLFPVNVMEKIVCEGGAMLLSERRDKNRLYELREFPKSIRVKDISLLERNKGKIITHAIKNLGGKLEGGKEVIISLNAPKNKTIEKFFIEVRTHLKTLKINKAVEITHSATAVDITPRGADKLTALKEVLKNDYLFYFGDARTDEDAMKISFGNIAPNNSMDSTKKQTKKAKLGILPEKNNIEGIIDSLYALLHLTEKAQKLLK